MEHTCLNLLHPMPRPVTQHALLCVFVPNCAPMWLAQQAPAGSQQSLNCVAESLQSQQHMGCAVHAQAGRVWQYWEPSP